MPDIEIEQLERSHHRGVDNTESLAVSFVAVDGEGVTLPNGEHRYVLFGVGQDQITDPNGLHWERIFELLESHWKPRQAFVGYYLGYDFTQWLKTMPENRARSLLTIEGKARRKSQSPKMMGRYLPVDIKGWQVDIIGHKRLSFRRHPCECLTFKCEHDKGPWIYVCDAGPFFQTSFLNTLSKLPPGVVTDAEYALVESGKTKRASAELDDDMRRYNRLENELLERVMHDLGSAFRKLGVRLTASQWYGPGQAAQAWLRQTDVPTRRDLEGYVNPLGVKVPGIADARVMSAARRAYYGGWFEIFRHGLQPGVSHEYDIRSAYPFACTNLPCLLHGRWTHGTGRPPRRHPHSVTVISAWLCGARRSTVIGSMLHRTPDGLICRPQVTHGLFWDFELAEAVAANVTGEYETREWWRYEWDCECPPPLAHVADLYQTRVNLGSKSSVGKAAKLLINSIYGKFAQTLGFAPYGNALYASLITARTRTMILNAIRTHPRKDDAVIMVATDAVFFDSPHPGLELSDRLGAWEHMPHENLTLYKPGMYWDDNARNRLGTVKARGVRAADLRPIINDIDETFQSFPHDRALTPDDWPTVELPISFAMVTALQALIRHKWHLAGSVQSDNKIMLSGAPYDKRVNVRWSERKQSFVSDRISIPVTGVESMPYKKGVGLDDPYSEESLSTYGTTPDGGPYNAAFQFLIRDED